MAEHSWPVLPERRAEDRRIAALATHVNDLRARVSAVEEGLDRNTQLTEQIADDTKVVRELMSEGRGAIKMLCRLAQMWRFLFRYLFLPALGVTLLWYYFTHDYRFPAWFEGLSKVFKL